MSLANADKNNLPQVEVTAKRESRDLTLTEAAGP